MKKKLALGIATAGVATSLFAAQAVSAQAPTIDSSIMPGGGNRAAVVADTLNISIEDLATALETQPLFEIAADHGYESRDAFRDAMQQTMRERWAAEGLSEEEISERETRMQEREQRREQRREEMLEDLEEQAAAKGWSDEELAEAKVNALMGRGHHGGSRGHHGHEEGVGPGSFGPMEGMTESES